MPILAMFISCDSCGKVTGSREPKAMLRDGRITCETCAPPDQVFKWIEPAFEVMGPPEKVEEEAPEEEPESFGGKSTPYVPLGSEEETPEEELDEALADAEDLETEYELHKEENAEGDPGEEPKEIIDKAPTKEAEA